MTNITEQFNNAGDVIWDVLFLINQNNQRVDILNLTPEIHIFEDMFTPNMSGYMRLSDTNNLIEKFPIIGQEELYLRCHTPGYPDQAIDKKFKITAITDRTVFGNNQNYTLHFISFDSYADLTTKETRAFKGTADIIIEKLLKNLWNKSEKLSATKNYNQLILGKELPENEVKFVSPCWPIFKCINAVTSSALNKDRIADYFFWESKSGYNLKSISEIFKEQHIDFLKYDATKPETEEGTVAQGELMRKIHKLMFRTDVDLIDRISNHGYGVKTITHDMLTKRLITEQDYLPNSPKLKFPTLNGNETFIKNTKDMDFNVPFNIQIANSSSWAHNEISLDNNGYSKNTRQTMITRLGFTELDLELWGRTWLETGKLIWLNYGNYSEDSYGTPDQDNSRLTGKYLITAIHHILAPAQHKMSIQVVKESVLNEIKPFS